MRPVIFGLYNRINLWTYRIYSSVSRPAYKSNWKKFAQILPKLEFLKTSEPLWYRLRWTNMTKNIILCIIFNDPRISRISKILFKIRPKFLDLYASTVVPKLFWCAGHLKYFSAPRTTKYLFTYGLTDHLS